MKCEFCGKEVAQGVTECPYCHYQFKIDAQVLSPDERDTFDGVTIEEDGSTVDHGADKDGGGEAYRQGQPEAYDRQDGYGRQQAPKVQVHTYGCGSGLLMTLLILGGILALFFFLLPTFIVFAAVGAVVVFLLRLFV